MRGRHGVEGGVGGVEEGVGDVVEGEEEEEGGLEVAVEAFFEGDHFGELAGGVFRWKKMLG